MKFSFTLVFFLLLHCYITAKNKTFTLNDVISGGSNYVNFQTEKLGSLKWTKEENTFSFVKNKTLFTQKTGENKPTPTLTLSQIDSITSEVLNTFPTHFWHANHVLQINLSTQIIFINVQKKSITKRISLPANAENPDLCPNATQVAFTVANNLYITTKDTCQYPVSVHTNPAIVSGQTVHRNEFGIVKGTFWSPKSNLLAFYKKDESQVSLYPLVDISTRVAEVDPIRYPMAGMASEQVQIGIYNTETEQTVFLKTGEPTDRYFTNISWSPDQTLLYVAELNRDQNHMQMVTYNVQTGKKENILFEEHNPKYVEPEHAALFSPITQNEFIWQSERDGHNHLYLYSTTGKLIKQITKGNWDVTQLLKWDDNGKTIFISSTEKSPIERHCYQINIKTGAKTEITSSPGTHKCEVSPNGAFVLDSWSSVTIPGQTDLIQVQKKPQIITLQSAPNPYQNYALGNASIIKLKANDSITDLYCRMITPQQKEEGKKYPVIVYVYGGPHVQQVHNQWMAGARMWQHYMAQQGYIAFTLDNRGSDGRGLAFENIIHRQLGAVEMEDQMTGIEYLKQLPFVDSTRIGVHGWSYGGFMTTSLMTQHAETFKVGVAGGPVIDWKYYEVMYGERYMDTPEQNPEGYKNSSLLNHA